MAVQVEAPVVLAEADQRVQEMLVDFVAGSASGCSGIMVGQPFDTVKVRMQIAPAAARTSALTCLKDICANEGPSALFKGMAPPLAASALVHAITFAAYAETNRWQQSRLSGGSPAQDAPPSVRQHFVSGCAAGLAQAGVTLPTDNIKCRLQAQVTGPNAPPPEYTGAMDCATKVVKRQGLQGLFTGGLVTLFREVPAYGLYFAVYESLKYQIQRRRQWGDMVCSSLAGGVAGTVSWISVYPFDVVKTIQQTAPPPNPGGHPQSMLECFRQLYAQGGAQVLYRGLGTTVARAFPVNAIIFPTYELVSRALRN